MTKKIPGSKTLSWLWVVCAHCGPWLILFPAVPGTAAAGAVEGGTVSAGRAGRWQQILLPRASLKCFLVRKSQLQEFITKKDIFMLCVIGFWRIPSRVAGVHQHGTALVAWKRAPE